VVGAGVPRLPDVARRAARRSRRSRRLRPGEERRTRPDRRSGVERRTGLERRRDALLHRPIWIEHAAASLRLQDVFPHADLTDTDVRDRAAAVETHRRDLSSRLGRNVGLPVAGLDYLMNVTRDLVAPRIVEHEVLAGLEHRAVTDLLTGLCNRYHFEATLKRDVARCRRYGARLTLVLLDVDQLKRVNDRWGHQVGDRVLRRVAHAISHSLRGSDTACRYGGDEFAVILPDTGGRAARLVAERICRNVATSHAATPAPETATRVTVSGGLAELALTATGGGEAELLVTADRALYRAKRHGGDGVAGGMSSLDP
jgi:diguanylate cyclase (GGDEF)-like protein